MKNIVIVGGGTAGWLTALYVKKICPNDNITLIESEEIGIIGAGEGAVPLVHNMINSLGLDINDLIKECNATIKLGIKFQNWNGDNTSYFAALLSNNDFSLKNPLQYGIYENGETLHYINSIANNESIEDYSLVTQLAYSNKSPIVKDGDEYMLTSNFSFQFDATLLAKYLRRAAEERGIIRIEGRVTKINENVDGGIKSVVTNDTEYHTDFIFDCTGFARLIIGKHYGTEWKSYQDKLKVNTAIPFFLPMDENIPTYMTATSMKYGWMWKTPLQNRYGCGYIFDSNYISVEDAQKEVEEHLGFQIKPIKTIPFNAGRYNTPWIKNCLAVGLSASFTEPIEATAIWGICNQLLRISNKNIYECDSDFIEEYNSYLNKTLDYTVDFLQFHYLTKRTDTDFWKTYADTTTLSPALERKTKRWKKRTPNWYDFGVVYEELDLIVWLTTAIGLDFIPNKVFVEENKVYDLDNRITDFLMQQKNYIDYLVNKSLTHNELLEMIKTNKFKIKL